MHRLENAGTHQRLLTFAEVCRRLADYRFTSICRRLPAITGDYRLLPECAVVCRSRVEIRVSAGELMLMLENAGGCLKELHFVTKIRKRVARAHREIKVDMEGQDKCNFLLSSSFRSFRSTLKLQFTLRRQGGHFLLHLYAPCVLVVTLSWIAFFIPRDSVAARISLGITSVLTTTTIMNIQVITWEVYTNFHPSKEVSPPFLNQEKRLAPRVMCLRRYGPVISSPTNFFLLLQQITFSNLI